nr:PREDICTED: hemicentin-1 [Bemisia tabaci]XP_018910569.1 PREDICTED: hemicentin-1 [Bemisia tabaci]XP_018910577.1 PREDICTED: hemicentin-1 [Bemisia tabaci]
MKNFQLLFPLYLWTTLAYLVPHGSAIPGGPKSTSLRHRQHGGSSGGGGAASGNSGGNEAAINEYTVQQHEEARLLCDLVGNDSIQWLHDGVPIGAAHNRYSREPRLNMLTISNVHLEDNGVWQCQDSDGLKGKPATLIVLDPPRAPYLQIDGRRLDPGNLFIPVKENMELSVECVIEGGSPAPRLDWLLQPSPQASSQDAQAPPPAPLALQTSNTSAYSGSGLARRAKIAKVQRAHHNATVACIAYHETFPTPLNASLLLDVQYTPSFGISRIPGFGTPLTVGIPVSLKCDVDSNPPSTPVWQKDNEPPPVEQSGDGFLNFTSIRRDHVGWYKCTARHLFSEYSSIGYYLNIVYDSPELEMPADEISSPVGGSGVVTVPGAGAGAGVGVGEVEVTLGGALQLECPAGVSGCWSRLGSRGHLEPVGPGPGLTIDRILYQEAGEYRCLPAKIAALDKLRTHSFHVKVVGGPVVYPSNSSIVTASGKHIRIVAEFCANPAPTRVIWVTETSVLRPGQRRERLIAHDLTAGSSRDCRQAALSINPVRPTDVGEYSLIVRSPKGVAEGSVLVNVTGVVGHVSSSGVSPIIVHPTSICIVMYLVALVLS